MLTMAEFLIRLYVLADDFCQAHPSQVRALRGRRGPAPQLSPAQILTLAAVSQWRRFSSERDFWRYAEVHLRSFFPSLPTRTQFNRASRRYGVLHALFFQHLAQQLGAEQAPYEIIDRFGVATRRSGRRGVGWLESYTDKGLCTRIGFFHGVQVLSVVTPGAAITGFAIAPASTKDQPMAEALFRERHRGTAPSTAGCASSAGIYLADMGFSGPARHRAWYVETGALLVCPPQSGHAPRWPALWRRAMASMRQVVETVHEKLLNSFRLKEERPHSISGLFTRLAAKSVLHNACICINRQLGRPDLAFCDLLGW